MGWKEDVAEWSKDNDKRPDVQENVLINKGWDPNKYQPSMKKALFDYLDKWNTLSVKTMPKPATSLQKNPIVSEIKRKFTQIGPWKIWSYPHNNGYLTVASDGTRALEFDSSNYIEALNIHLDLAKTL